MTGVQTCALPIFVSTEIWKSLYFLFTFEAWPPRDLQSFPSLSLLSLSGSKLSCRLPELLILPIESCVHPNCTKLITIKLLFSVQFIPEALVVPKMWIIWVAYSKLNHCCYMTPLTSTIPVLFITLLRSIISSLGSR